MSNSDRDDLEPDDPASAPRWFLVLVLVAMVVGAVLILMLTFRSGTA